MIKIGKITKTIRGGLARVAAPITIDAATYDLWYEVPDKYANALCADRSDAFVAGLIPLALKKREDISYESPLTWEIYDSVRHDFIDVLCQHQPELYSVRLLGPTCPSLKKSEIVCGTGVSCGVDSLFTIKRRLVNADGNKKYLLLNNMTDEDKASGISSRAHRFSVLKHNAECFAADAGIELIIGDSNYTSGEIPGLMAEGQTTFCNLFCVLSLQNLFTRYYVASGGPVRDFGLYIRNGIFNTDCSNYDLLTFTAFSTSSCKFLVDGLEDRVKKMEYICNWPLTQRYLDVCFVHPEGVSGNGTYDCPKCMHTVVEVLSQGGLPLLEKFHAVFDVDYVRSHMHQYLADVMRVRLTGHEYGRELWPLRGKMGFSYFDYVKALWIVGKKIVKKCIRGGSVSKKFSPEG